MSFAIRRVDTGEFLAWYDPDWTPEGWTPAVGQTGLSMWTSEPDQVLTFETTEALLALYTAQSTVLPLRADGRPNRPLTAYTVEIARYEVAG